MVHAFGDLIFMSIVVCISFLRAQYQKARANAQLRQHGHVLFKTSPQVAIVVLPIPHTVHRAPKI
jgi:hypothetical protein